MRYMGSKRRIAKHIVPIIMAHYEPGMVYIEPFAGGMNMIEHVNLPIRYAYDNNKYVIALFKALQNGWGPPETISREEWYNIKNNKELHPAELVGFVGFGVSFGGKFFGGYISPCDKHSCAASRRSVLKQIKKLQNVKFKIKSVFDITPPPNSLIYCDPPYNNTTKYHSDFNHAAFWNLCRDWSADGHRVLISEYSAPDDFICLWEKSIDTPLGSNAGADKKSATEKLFVHTSVHQNGGKN